MSQTEGEVFNAVDTSGLRIVPPRFTCKHCGQTVDEWPTSLHAQHAGQLWEGCSQCFAKLLNDLCELVMLRTQVARLVALLQAHGIEVPDAY